MPVSSLVLPDARAVLSQTPMVCRALLGSLPPRLLIVDEGPGTWSPLQVLQHLVWGEVDDWAPRIRCIREQGTVTPFAPFDREEGFRRYQQWSVEDLLQEFARLRQQSLVEFDRLSPEILSAEGRHPEFGTVTMEQLVATWVTHDLGHIVQISRVLAKESGRFVGPWKAYLSVLTASRSGG